MPWMHGGGLVVLVGSGICVGIGIGIGIGIPVLHRRFALVAV